MSGGPILQPTVRQALELYELLSRTYNVDAPAGEKAMNLILRRHIKEWFEEATKGKATLR
jgi:hypothetical protein